MSGGHWNYSGYRIKDMLNEIGIDSAVKERFPRLANALVRFGEVFYQIESNIDWDICGDSSIENDIEFETKYISMLRMIVSADTEVQDIDDELKKLEERIKQIRIEMKSE